MLKAKYADVEGGMAGLRHKTQPPQFAVTAVTPYDGVRIERRGIMLQTGTSMSCACAGQTQGRVWGLCSVLQVYLGSPPCPREASSLGSLSRILDVARRMHAGACLLLW
jgi:hypothetical protein